MADSKHTRARPQRNIEDIVGIQRASVRVQPNHDLGAVEITFSASGGREARAVLPPSSAENFVLAVICALAEIDDDEGTP